MCIRDRDGATETVADALLEPSVIYAPAVAEVLDATEVHGIAHITGGGLVGNLPRCFGDHLDAVIDRGSWTEPPIFDEVRRHGDVADDEMLRVFNLGVGMCLVLPAESVSTATELLSASGHQSWTIGEITPGTGTVAVS